MGRKVILTGASGAIGQAIAKRFLQNGDIVLLAGNRHTDALEALANGSSGASSMSSPASSASGSAAFSSGSAASASPRAFVFSGDLSTAEGCAALFAYADEVLGTPDLLINNAGISHVGLLQDFSDEELVTMLNSNLLSSIRLSKEAAKRMLRVHSGRILQISSVWGLYGASTETSYSAAKGGVNAFTRAFAKELAPSGISVNALAPGAVDTPMNGHLSAEEKQALSDEIPIGRMASPEEVAEMVFLLSNAPLYLTGAVIPFDGGWF